VLPQKSEEEEGNYGFSLTLGTDLLKELVAGRSAGDQLMINENFSQGVQTGASQGSDSVMSQKVDFKSQ